MQEHPELLLDVPADPAAGAGAGLGTGADAADGLPTLLSHVVRLEFPERERGWVPEVEVRPYAIPMHRVIPGLVEVPQRIGVALMNPVGGGRVHADGSVHLPGDPRDATALAEATAFVAERLGIAGAVTRSTSQHLSGAARIGEVCDDSGRVLGVVGVRVADASVLPSLPRCGPYYTVLAVAEDLAVRMATERAW